MKKPYNSMIKRQMTPLKKWANNSNRSFSKGNVPEANEHMKRCSRALVVRKMQIRIIRRYYPTPTETAGIKNGCTNDGENTEKLKASFVAGGNVQWCSCFTVWQCVKMLSIEFTV